jgi:hypothetical protein
LLSPPPTIDLALIVDTVIPLLVDKILTVDLTQPESVEPPFGSENTATLMFRFVNITR